MILPNPNQPIPNYVYPFDMWVTKLAGGQFALYINGEQIQPEDSGLDFFIPAGELSSSAWQKLISITVLLTSVIRNCR